MGPDFEITPDTVIADVFRHYPECMCVFDKHNMPCQTCMGASTDTIREGAMMHDVDADKIIMELKECCARASGTCGGQTAS